MKTWSLNIASIVKAIKCPEYCSINLSIPLSIAQAITIFIAVDALIPTLNPNISAPATIPNDVIAVAAKNPNIPNDIVIIIIGASGFKTFISLNIILNPDCLFCSILYHLDFFWNFF